jgi:16S rRNA (adenine1518-N6/adenine1519-N6)-dimethyltransferase
MSAHKQVNAARRNAHTLRKPKLGQNFLVDASAARRIIEALGEIRQSVVVEIGPGRGALTQLLAGHAERLFAIEFDSMLAQHLRVALANSEKVEVVEADFLNISLAELLGSRELQGQRAKVVGNIPYYITSDILLRLFEQHESIEMIVVMVQKEVADRLAAEPGSRDYGLLTVTTNLFADVEKLFTLPPGAFSPPPQVYSSVLRFRISPKANALQVDAGEFLKFCKLAFAKKRKTLFNNLRERFAQEEVRKALEKSSLRVDVRAEALALHELAAIYRTLTDVS